VERYPGLRPRPLGWRDTGTPFVAGLLHDLGKVILDTYYNDLYQEVVEEMVEEERSALDVETDVLDIDHAEVGGWLAARWKFPEVLVVPIACHHNLMAADEAYQKDALIVHLANIITKRSGIGLCYESEIPEPSDLVESVLGLGADKIEEIQAELQNEQDQIQEFFNNLTG